MNIDAFIKKLAKIKADKAFKAVASAALLKEEKKLLARLKAHSPVDSGYFASRWKIKRVKFQSSNALAGLSITNDTPDYGRFATSGAEPNKAPWYYPNRDKKGKFRKGTGKLKKSAGKVWAGGLNPGHDKTVGGTVENALKSAGFDGSFTKELSKDLVKVFSL